MPTRQEIENALKNPGQFAPAVERLGGGWLATDAEGTLASPGGSEALVVRLDRPSGQSIALRIPYADDGDPAAMAVHTAFAGDPVIGRLRAISPSPIAGGVSVIPRGLLLPQGRGESRPHPVIAMEWIGDLTLADVVRRLVAANDVVRLGGLGTRFVRLKQLLGEHRFSHGDLTPNNIVVRRGDALAVVDYDTAAWPGSPRGRIPAPAPAYRHPSGSLPVVLERRDDFAALVMLVTLRALAIDTGMLFPMSLHPEHGLVLSASDLKNPTRSERFRRLSLIDDPETVALSAILAEVCQKPVDQAPPFEEVIRAAKAVTGRLRRASQPPPAKPVYQAVEPEPSATALGSRDRQLRVTRLNALLLAGADEEAIRFWEASGLADDPAAIEQAGDLVNEARVRLEAAHRPPPPPEPEPPRYDPRGEWRVISTGASMARLEQAIATGDRTTVLTEWSDVRETTAASRYAATVHQIANEYWSDAVRLAARRDDAGGVLDVIDRADRAGVPIPAALRPLMREARSRVEQGADGPAESAIGWEERLPSLARALQDEDDRQIVTALAWEPTETLDRLPAPVRARAELALRRIDWADGVRAALRRRDQALLQRLLAHPVPGAEALLGPVERKRIARDGERRAAQGQLHEALASGTNREFVRAMRRLEACAAELPSDLDHAAFTEAIERITRLTALRRAVTDPDQDARTIARLVPAALTRGTDWATVERLVNLGDVDRELVKSARVVRIREALVTGNDEAIAAAAMPDPHDVLIELSELEREQVEAALKAAKPLAGRKSFMADPAKVVAVDEGA
ncbi:MAG: hypothetical protein IT334_13565 [Thermomicrobiales bacterium]|nr:hypothetical protein [Thermomicrobiales bacterium]